MSKKIERRCFPVQEFRATRDGDGPTRLTGYAAVFDSLSENFGGFREKISPGAFSDSIKTDDIRALFNHSSDFVLGRNVSGTLRLSEDEHGLAIDIDMPDTQTARDLLVSVERGDVSQMSFGFRTIDDIWERVDGEEIRTLKKVSLFDVSPVTFPAYTDTEVEARQMIYDEAVRNNNIPEEPRGSDGQDEGGPGGRPNENLRRRLKLVELEN